MLLCAQEADIFQDMPPAHGPPPDAIPRQKLAHRPSSPHVPHQNTATPARGPGNTGCVRRCRHISGLHHGALRYMPVSRCSAPPICLQHCFDAFDDRHSMARVRPATLPAREMRNTASQQQTRAFRSRRPPCRPGTFSRNGRTIRRWPSPHAARPAEPRMPTPPLRRFGWP